jgi:hypothetical protein
MTGFGPYSVTGSLGVVRRPSSVVRRPVFPDVETTTFRELALFASSGEGRSLTSLRDPTEWISRSPYMGTIPIQFPNRFSFPYPRIPDDGDVHDTSDSDRYAPSSESHILALLGPQSDLLELRVAVRPIVTTRLYEKPTVNTNQP